MSYNTQNLLRDVKALPIPQTWNPTVNEYSPFTGDFEIQNGFLTGSISVGTSAVELKVGASPLANRRKLIFRVRGNDAIYLGYQNTVTTSTGFPILPGQQFAISFDPMKPVSVYAIAASSQTVKLLECN